MEQANQNPNVAPGAASGAAPAPTSAQAQAPAQSPNVIVVPVQPAKVEEKWFESRHLQAAFITGAISFIVNILNTLLTKIR